MKQEFKEVFKRIDFVRSFIEITKKHNFDDGFENYSNAEVIKIISEFGYKAKYNKSENFFKITEKKQPFLFQLNIICKYGYVTFVTDVLKNEQRIELGSTWGTILKHLGYEEQINKPTFRTYEDLREILKEAFGIYEDFKQELLKQENKL